MTSGTEGRPGRSAPATLARFARDFLLVVGVILVYFEFRALAPADIPTAVETTRSLIRFEQATGTFHERQLQEWTLRADWLKETANFIYAYMHFPALAVVGAALWWRDRAMFFVVRNTMFVSMLFGLVFYYAIPAAPPRLMAMHGYDYGFVDTVFGGDTAIRYPQPSFYVNAYAALPSFHFGWIALASAGLWLATRNWAVRAVAVLLTVVMTWASAATANHLFIDMVIGGLVVLAAAIVAIRVSGVSSRPGRIGA